MADNEPLTAKVAELTHYIETLVASSVATHRILRTPSDTMSLQESAERVIAELDALKASRG